MKKNKSKSINFCESCSYFEDGEEDNNEAGKCPKCNMWMWTIYENIYYDSGKVIGREAGITDNDECSFHGDTLNRLNRIFKKGFKLIGK